MSANKELSSGHLTNGQLEICLISNPVRPISSSIRSSRYDNVKHLCELVHPHIGLSEIRILSTKIKTVTLQTSGIPVRLDIIPLYIMAPVKERVNCFKEKFSEEIKVHTHYILNTTCFKRVTQFYE